MPSNSLVARASAARRATAAAACGVTARDSTPTNATTGATVTPSQPSILRGPAPAPSNTANSRSAWSRAVVSNTPRKSANGNVICANSGARSAANVHSVSAA